MPPSKEVCCSGRAHVREAQARRLYNRELLSMKFSLEGTHPPPSCFGVGPGYFWELHCSSQRSSVATQLVNDLDVARMTRGSL